MSRILLADDSAHAQRMGECILREEGFEVVSVTDGDTAVLRLEDVDPDVILADVLLPRKSGYEICSHVKGHPKLRHVRVILTAGALEPLDEEEARRVQADASLRKPFEASMLLEMVRRLVEVARQDREAAPPQPAAAGDTVIVLEPAQITEVSATAAPEAAVLESEAQAVAEPLEPEPGPATITTASVPDPELVRAAVTLALDASMPLMIDEITARVMGLLKR